MRNSRSCLSALKGAEVTQLSLGRENYGEENYSILVASLFSSLGFGLLESAFAVAEGQWDGAKALLLSEPQSSEER